MHTTRPAVFTRLLPMMLSACLAVVPLRAEAAMPPAALVEIYSGDGTVDAMARDGSGKLCLAGSYASAMTIGTTNVLKAGFGTRDLFVARYTADGIYIDHASALSISASSVTPTAITADDSGNCYVAGIYEGGAVSDFGFSAPNGQRDGFVVKYDTNGHFSWAKQIGAAIGGTVVPTDIAVDSTTGAVFVTGDFSVSAAVPGIVPLVAIGARDAMVIRLSTDNGSAVWGKTIGGAGSTTPSAVMAKAKRLALDRTAQDIYLGIEYGGGGLTYPFNLGLQGGQDFFLIKVSYDGNGNTPVQGLAGSSGTYINIGGLALDNAGVLHIGGNFDGGAITGPADAAMTALGSDTGFLVDMTTDGSINRAIRFGGAGASVQVRTVGLDPQSRPFVAGTIGGAGLAEPAADAFTLAGARDGLALGFDGAGNIAWVRHYGGPGASLTSGGMAVNADSNIYWAGRFTGGSLTVPPTSSSVSSGALVLMDIPPRRTLTIASPSHGSVRDGGGDLGCGTSCTTSYANGATVTLTATPDTGYTFAGWGGDCGGTDNPLTLTMNAAKSCSASFAASNPGNNNPAPATPATPAPPAAPPAFVATPVPATLDAATTGAGSGKLSLAAAFTNPAALSFAVSSGSTTPLPAWLTFDPATVSFSYDVPLPGNLPIQPIADGDAAKPAGRADARASWANTIYPPLIRVAQLPVTLTATGAGQSYAATIRMSFYAPRPRVSVAALSLSQDGALGNARSTRPALSFDAGQVLFQTAATNLFPAAPNTDTDIVRYHALSGTRDRISQTAIPGGGVANAANGASLNPAVSPDGRYAAFASDAPGITLTPSGRVRQVYRTSLAHPRIDLDPARTPAPDFVSTTADGIPGNAPSDRPALSEDARFVAFESAATNLAPGLDGTRQIWRKDLATGTIALVSANGTPGNGPSGNPSISWDGRFVAFESAATNLAANPGTGTQLYLKDMNTGAVRLVSAQAGRPANAAATSPVLSARADKLAFVTSATNLGFANQAGRAQVVVADLATNSINLVSDTSADSDQPAISADGRFVVFRAAAAGTPQIWVRDTARGVTALVSQTASGTPGNAASWTPAIAGDASSIAFASDARDLVNGNPAAGQAYIAANPLVIPQKTAYWCMPDIGGGQGWVTERWGDRAYVAALAYDATGRSQWLAGFCSLSGLTCSGNLQGWTGGTPFGLPGAASPVPAPGPAFAILTADTGRTATLAIAGGTPATLAPYPIGGSATTALAGLPQAGWWYEPDAAGSANGYFLGIATQAQSGGGTAQIGYLSVLTFDAAGRPEWLSAQATLAADLAFAATLYRYQGGAPIGQSNAAGNPDALAAGQVRLSFDGPDRATISLPNGRIANIRRFRF